MDTIPTLHLARYEQEELIDLHTYASEALTQHIGNLLLFFIYFIV